MKNLLLSVALLLTVSFAFASNDVEKVVAVEVEEVLDKTNSTELSIVTYIIIATNLSEDGTGMCYYTIITITTYPDGTTYKTSQEYATPASSLEDCTNRANAHAAHLNKSNK